MVAKLAGYHDLATAGGPRYPVLFWLPSIRRETNLHTALTRQPTKVPVATTNSEIATDSGGNPADPIWLPAGTHQRRRLADLADLADSNPTIRPSRSAREATFRLPRD